MIADTNAQLSEFKLEMVSTKKKYKKVNRGFTLGGGGVSENRWAVHFFFVMCFLLLHAFQELSFHSFILY